MSTPAQRRLIKDLMRLQQQDSDFMCCPINDNLLLWTATFQGPQNTIWEGGLFTLRLLFTQRYPNAPPRVKFLNKMFHPNIYNDGRICLDMLYNQWSPIYDVWAMLTAIKTLLSDPNPQSPANIEASNVFRDNKIQYEYRVRQIVQQSLQFQENAEQIVKQAEKQLKEKEAQQAKGEKQLKLRQEAQQRFGLKKLISKQHQSKLFNFDSLRKPRKVSTISILPITATPNSSFNNQEQYSNQQYSQDDNDSESFGSQSDEESNIKQNQSHGQTIQKLQKEIERINKHELLLATISLQEASNDKQGQDKQINRKIKQEECNKQDQQKKEEKEEHVILITRSGEKKQDQQQQGQNKIEGKHSYNEEQENHEQERFELKQQSSKCQGEQSSEEQSEPQPQECQDDENKQGK